MDVDVCFHSATVRLADNLPGDAFAASQLLKPFD
jgi:hypothetical protein